MKHTSGRKREIKANDINNALSDSRIMRERNRCWSDSHERTRKKGFRRRPFADADLIVPDSYARWWFLPRGRVNAISAYCLSRARARASVFAKAVSAPFYGITIILLPWLYMHTLGNGLSIISAG